MAPFFDTPGSTAGPYHTPPQQGIFSKILQGVDVALKLGDFYQNWQAKNQARENAGIQGVTNRLALARAIAGPDVDIAATPELMKGAEGIWPKVTVQAKESMGEDIMSGIAPTTGEAVPGGGGFVLPGGGKIVDTGGMATRLKSPELTQKQASYEQGMAAIPEVGGPIPFRAQPKKVAVIGRGGMVKSIALPPGTSQVIQEKVAPQFGVWDGENFIPTPGRPILARPSQEEIQARQIAVQEARNKGKVGPTGGGGRPDVITFAKQLEKAYQEEKSKPGNENLTRVQFRKMWAAAGRSDPTALKTVTKEQETKDGVIKTTTKEKNEPQPTPGGSQVVPPTNYGGKYYSEGNNHFQWDGTKYVPYTGK